MLRLSMGALNNIMAFHSTEETNAKESIRFIRSGKTLSKFFSNLNRNKKDIFLFIIKVCR